MKKHHVGVIGYGNAAKAHINALNASTCAQVTAVCSSRELDAAQVSQAHGSTITCHRDLDTMLAGDVDAVSICSYPHLHAEHVIKVARAGKHIILEKPISLNLEDAKRIEAEVAAAGVKACVCFEVRHSNQFTVTKSVIDAGMIGQIHYGEIDYYHGIGPWSGQFKWNTTKRSGGSSLLSAGCHALNALQLCMGGTVRSVTSLATRSASPVFAQYEYPTTTVTLLQFEDGRVGKVASLIDCLQPYYFHVHLVGSEGSILDNKFHSSRIDGLDKRQWSKLALQLADSGNVHDHPYLAQFESFFQAIESGTQVPLTGLKESLITHRVIMAADLSAQRGESVLMEELA